MSIYALFKTLGAALDPLCVGSYLDDLNQKVTTQKKGRAFFKPALGVATAYSH